MESTLEGLDPAVLLFLRRLRRVECRLASAKRVVLEYSGSSRPAEGLAREAVSSTTTPPRKARNGDGPEPTVAVHGFFVSRASAAGRTPYVIITILIIILIMIIIMMIV